MRILGVGDCIELGDLYLSLIAEGHEVRVFAGDPSHRGTLAGLIEPVADWRAELSWVGRDGIILFETVGQGAAQDRLRSDGYCVIGGSAFGDRLENDRACGQALLRETGLAVAPSRAFESAGDAARWIEANPGRYALKYDNSAHPTFVGAHAAGADVRFQLARSPAARILLMDALDGVEVGIGAYFDGARFLEPACIDFEHKRFFPGDLGEMTGEMGTLARFDGAARLYRATLARVAPRLAEAGHVGYVNLNLIVNESGIWPLEFTCRFGYPGYAVLAPLQRDGWGDLLRRIRDRAASRAPAAPDFATLPHWSVAIVLTMPPFPAGPIFFHTAPDPAEARHYRLMDVRLDGGQLFARRHTGYVMVVTGTGDTVEAAREAAAARARNVVIPDLRWRNDIGLRFLAEDGARLRNLGWL
jgi:phosphoribosylamine--glycine ligase